MHKPPAITEFDLEVAGLDDLKEYRNCIDSNDGPYSDFLKLLNGFGMARNRSILFPNWNLSQIYLRNYLSGNQPFPCSILYVSPD